MEKKRIESDHKEDTEKQSLEVPAMELPLPPLVRIARDIGIFLQPNAETLDTVANTTQDNPCASTEIATQPNVIKLPSSFRDDFQKCWNPMAKICIDLSQQMLTFGDFMKQSLHAPLAKVDGTKHTRNCNGERTETAKRSRTLSLHDEDDHELNKIEMPVRIEDIKLENVSPLKSDIHKHRGDETDNVMSNAIHADDFTPFQTAETKAVNMISPEYIVRNDVRQEQRFCFCGLEKGGRMVRCSNLKSCKNQWFHFGDAACVEYDEKKYHGKKWYCSVCKNTMGKSKMTKIAGKFGKAAQYLSRIKTPVKKSDASRFNVNLTARSERSPSSESLLDLHVEEDSKYYPSPLKKYQGEGSEDVSAFEQFKTPEKNKDWLVDEDVLSAKKQTDFTVKSKLDKVVDIKSIPKSVLEYKHEKHLRFEIKKKDFEKFYIPVGNERKSAKLLEGWGKLIDLHFEEIDFPCSFNVRTYNFRKKNRDFSVYGYCNADCPTRYTGTLGELGNKGRIICDIDVIGDCKLIQTKASGRRCTATAKLSLQRELVAHKALNIHSRKVSTVKERRLLQQNLPVRRLDAVRKMKSDQHLKTQIKRTDLFGDLKKVKLELLNDPRLQSKSSVPSGFIQRIGYDPFHLTMYSPLQAQFAANSEYLYLDATGSICEAPDKESKRLLLHAVVAKLDDKSVSSVPVLEFLTTKNDTVEISSQLNFYRHHVLGINKKWQPKSVTVDFSFAYLHSVSRVFNDESLVSYINRSFDCLHDASKQKPGETRIQICTNHVMHAFSRNLSKKNVDKDIKTLALHNMGKLVEAKSLDEFKSAVRQFIIVFGCKNVTKKLLHEYSHDLEHGTLQRPYSEEITELEKKFSDEDMAEILPESDSDMQREQSSYYTYFKKKQAEVAKVMAEMDTDVDNPFYSSQVMTTMSNTYIPYFPLWGVLGGSTPFAHGTSRSSTASIERKFGDMKQNVHKKLKYMPQFAQDEGVHVIGLINTTLSKELRIDVDKPKDITVYKARSTSKSVIKPQTNNVLSPTSASTPIKDKDSDQLSQEEWKKKPTRKAPKYVKRELSQYFSQSKQPVIKPSPTKAEKYLKGLGKKNKARRNLFKSVEKSKDTKRRLSPVKELVETALEGLNKALVQTSGENKTYVYGDSKGLTSTDIVLDLMQNPDPSTSILGMSKLLITDKKTKFSWSQKAAVIEKRTMKNKEDAVLQLSDDSEEDVYHGIKIDGVRNLKKNYTVFEYGKFLGDESDLATLHSKSWLNDSVMNCYGELLVDQHKVSDNDLPISFAASNTVLKQKDLTGKMLWTENIDCLPTSNEFDSEQGTIYMPGYSVSHWWLVEIDFASKSVNSYDSGSIRKLVETTVKQEHFNRLTRLLEQRYGIPSNNWTYEECKCPQQPHSYECGPMALLFLQKKLSAQSIGTATSEESDEFRNEIASILLQTHENGLKLISMFDRDLRQILEKLHIRKVFRSQLYSMKKKSALRNKNIGRDILAHKTDWEMNL